jgi:hypothetical protein
MKRNFSTIDIKERSAKFLIIAIALVGTVLGIIGFNGCADYAAVGVGYSAAYYAPDYRPFYGYYAYDGVPWWGANVTYVRNNVVVRGDHHRAWYGGHHFTRDWHRGRVASVPTHRARR